MYQELQKIDLRQHSGEPSVVMLFHLRRVSDLFYLKLTIMSYEYTTLFHFLWMK